MVLEWMKLDPVISVGVSWDQMWSDLIGLDQMKSSYNIKFDHMKSKEIRWGQIWWDKTKRNQMQSNNLELDGIIWNHMTIDDREDQKRSYKIRLDSTSLDDATWDQTRVDQIIFDEIRLD